MKITKGQLNSHLIDIKISIEESKSPYELLFYKAQEAVLLELLGKLDENEGYFEQIIQRIHFPIPQPVVKVITKEVERPRQWDKFKDWDHRWDDHPSWFTDNKMEQRLMIYHSKARARNSY